MRHSLCPTALVLATVVVLAAAPARAFLPAVATEGPLTLEIARLQPLEIAQEPREVEVSVSLKNAEAQPIRGTLEIGLTDGWKVTRNQNAAFEIAGHASRTIAVGVTPSRGAYSAHYPIHATARFSFHGLEVGLDQNPERTVHTVLVVQTKRAPWAQALAPTPLVRAEARGATPLLVARWMQPRWTLDSAPQTLVTAPSIGDDAASGASFSLQTASRPDSRPSLGIHPPWRIGAGEAMADFRVSLPDVPKLALSFATAIRDSNTGEPQSDGVQFRVLVDEGSGFQELFNRFSASKTWQEARVDLSKFRAKIITLRLQSGPGPARNTSVDQSFWGAPAIIAGSPPAPESQLGRQKRRARALNLARAARAGKPAPWAWTLRSNALAGVCGAAIVPGRSGLRDAFIAFSQAGREIVFEGFGLAIETPNGTRALGVASGELAPQRVASTWEVPTSSRPRSQGILSHILNIGGRSVTLQARVWEQGGALRFAWSLPGVQPDARGVPRIARVALGAASSSVRRAYAGFGNVIQQPGRWSLSDGGFRLPTRHVGADYANGLSLVQGSDIFPDAFEVDGPRGLASLAVHHNATLSLIPSSRGAFASARIWRALSGFKAAGGVSKLLGRVGLDQWGGDYAQAAADLEKAAAYGMRDAVFVKHVWQRWGYDLRLPDIYPPSGDQAAFLQMVRAAKKNGILFCPHDNYIDFYPDAQGFSYKHILFNADGTPQLAWLNRWAEDVDGGSQSYRWSPLAFGPWLDRNLKLVKSGFGPTSYFVDVFSAIAPFDFYDQAGRFYSKTVMQERWGAAFDRMRQVLGDSAPTISEAGTDALIGHLDGAQSDHPMWVAPGTAGGEGDDKYFRWELDGQDGERVPWHDMATHNRFVLFAGGLGHRYAGGQNGALHSWGSDDYLSNTILGGRSPMSDGPFSRRAVMTYWLLHDISARLARLEMVAHGFAGDDIHRQQIAWADAKTLAPSGTVRVNRGLKDWAVETRGAAQVLPQYGFSARIGSGANEVRADISRRAGVISAFALDARSKTIFADARPERTSDGSVRARVLGARGAQGGKLSVDFEWQVLAPISARFRPFLHFTSPEASGEGIVFQGEMDFSHVDLSRPGTYRATALASLPADAQEGAAYNIRFGLFDSAGGERFPIASPSLNNRVAGGQIVLRGAEISYVPEAPDPSQAPVLARLNREDKMLDFGPLATNGALRLSYVASTWTLMPLPNSAAFRVRLNLARLGARGRKVARLEAMSESGAKSVLTFVAGESGPSFEVPSGTQSVTILLG